MRLLFLVLLTSFLVNQTHATPPEKRVLNIILNDAGRVTVGGGDTIGIADVPKQVRDALFKSSLGNRKYYKISISQTGGNVSIANLNMLKDMVHEGQLAALNAICLEKFKSRYDALDSKKKEKLKKQYPVLFQTEYS